jgi:hypothetical protein
LLLDAQMSFTIHTHNSFNGSQVHPGMQAGPVQSPGVQYFMYPPFATPQPSYASNFIRIIQSVFSSSAATYRSHASKFFVSTASNRIHVPDVRATTTSSTSGWPDIVSATAGAV